MENEKEKLSSGYYVIGGLSFIPLIGVIFGVISVVIGIIKRKIGGKKLIVIGALGIAFTLILYSSLFYFGFVQRGGVYDKLRKELTNSTLKSLVKNIEFYKLQNDKYPDSLEDLVKSQRSGKSSNDFTFINDPMSLNNSLFYYEIREGGNKYYLFSKGIDNKEFTEDDIFPAMDNLELKNTGYVKPRN